MAAGLAGLVIGSAGMRLQGTHLALATFAVAVAMPQFLRFSGMEPLTGGPGGILIDMPSPPFGLEIASDLYLFFLVSAVALAVLWVGENMARGRLGRMLIAARDNPVAAASTGGLDVGPLRVKLFVVTAAMTGIAGGLNAMLTLFVSPDGFTLFLSISLLVG
ncbi:branched-chain amino acid ABC transporter permease, partial [Rhizobiaceae sp. 2RAB30]